GGVVKAVPLAGVQERGGVGKDPAAHHHGEDRPAALTAPRGRASTPPPARRNGHRHPPAHFLRRLGHLTVPSAEVTLTKHAQGGLGPLADSRWAGLAQHPFLLLSMASEPSSPAVGEAIPRQRR